MNCSMHGGRNDRNPAYLACVFQRLLVGELAIGTLAQQSALAIMRRMPFRQ
jgi:hypothetical protein